MARLRAWWHCRRECGLFLDDGVLLVRWSCDRKRCRGRDHG